MDDLAWRDAAKQRFAFDTWPNSISSERTMPHARNFAFDVKQTPDWILDRRSAYGDRQYTDFLSNRRDPPRHATVAIKECADAAAARLALLDLLADSMAPTLPRLRDSPIGDVAFTGHENSDEAVTFVRGNIVVSVRSAGREPASVIDLARSVDAQIQKAQR